MIVRHPLIVVLSYMFFLFKLLVTLDVVQELILYFFEQLVSVCIFLRLNFLFLCKLHLLWQSILDCCRITLALIYRIGVRLLHDKALDLFCRRYLTFFSTVNNTDSQFNDFFNVRIHVSVLFCSFKDHLARMVDIITLWKTYGLKYDINYLLKLLIF